MTVYVSHAPPDLAVAEALESALERRGNFVERDDGETALRPVTPADVVILLHSKDFVFAPMRLRLEQRALDAWAAGRLIMVKLDHNFAPVGLRDLPFIDASFEAQREFKWNEIAEQVRRILSSPPPDAEKKSRADEPLDRDAVWRRWRAEDRGALLIGVLAMLPGVAALIVSGAIFLVNRIGPTPGTFADLVAGVDAFGVARGAMPGATPIVFAAALLLMVLAPVLMALSGWRRRRARAAFERGHPEMTEDYEGPSIRAAPAPASEATFVSYARANSALVMPVIEGARAGGQKFWIDTEGIVTGDGWAGEIVRAIKSAAGVAVMCSKAAFESDHVKREVYLADRYAKKLFPIYVEAAEPPEDFEYFFAGVQRLNLFDVAEAERADAVSKALAGAPAAQ